MRIVYMGTPDFAVLPLKALLEQGYQVAGVVTQPDRPKGRRGEPAPSPVKECAVAAGLMVLQPEKLRDPAFFPELAALEPDLIVVTAYGQIIPKSILQLPRYGCINIHASLLPKYRGAAPIQYAVIDGEKYSGVTIMQMDEGLDTGDILTQSCIPLAPDETGGSLFDRLAKEGADLLLRTIPQIEAGTLLPVKQPAQSPTPYAAMLTKQMGKLDFTCPAPVLERLIRGVSPWPGAYTHLKGKTLKIWRAELETESGAAAVPGTVLEAGKGLTVQCGEGVLRLLEVQLEGKKRMPVEAFLRGYVIESGEVLGKE